MLFRVANSRVQTGYRDLLRGNYISMTMSERTFSTVSDRTEVAISQAAALYLTGRSFKVPNDVGETLFTD